MIKDLNQVYKEATGIPSDTNDNGGPTVKVKPVSSKGQVSAADAYLNMVNSTPNSMQRAGQAFQFNADAKDVENYLGASGVADPSITGQDNAILMGQHQSMGAKIARKAANIVPNIAAGLIDMVGDVGNLAAQWGDNRDYDNILNKAAAAIRDPAGVGYARTGHTSFSNTLADPNWWVDNIGGLAEFATTFAIGGAGAAGAMSKITEGAAGLLEAGEAGSRVASAAAQLGTSGLMGYTMAARGGAHIYDMTYQIQLQKLLAEGKSLDDAQDQAKHIAAQSAATTVQLSTVINTALNLGSMAPYFRNGEQTAATILKKEFPQMENETAQAWGERIANLDPAAYKSLLMPGRSIGHKALEGTKMGLEMMQLQFGEKTGEELGREGKTEGFLEQFGQLENFFDRTMNKDGALAFAIGAVSGLGIDFLRNDVIPSKYMVKMDAQGNPMQKVGEDGQLKFDAGGKPVFERTLVKPRTVNEFQAVSKFTTLRDAVAEDIKNFGSMQQNYIKAVGSGDAVAADRARDEMFNVANIHAVHTGMGEGWKNTYSDIATMPQDKAVEVGYAKDANDNAFREKAHEAISDLNSYQKVYDDLQKRYGTQYEANVGLKDVVDMIFSRKVDLMQWDKTLQKHEKQLTELEGEEAKMTAIANPDIFNQEVLKYQKELQGAKAVHESITTDYKALEDAIKKDDYNSVKGLVRKYRAKGMTNDDMQSAVNDLSRKLSEHAGKQTERIKTAEDAMFNSTGYKTWLEQNPGKSFEEYRNRIQEKLQYSESNPIYRAQIEKSRTEYNIANENLADITRERNVPKFVRKYNNWMERLKKETDEVEKTKNAELAARAKDKTLLSKLQKVEMSKIGERYKAVRDEAVRKQQHLEQRIREIKAEQKDTPLFKNPKQHGILRSMLKEFNKELVLAKATANHYDSLYRKYHVDTTTPEAEVPVETVTAENNDIQESALVPEQTSLLNEFQGQMDDEAIEKKFETTTEDDAALAEFNALMNEDVNTKIQAIEKEYKTNEELVKYYQGLIEPLPTTVKSRIHEVEMKLLSKEIEFSYDLLKGIGIEPNKAAQILQAIKEIIDTVSNIQGEEAAHEYEAEVAVPQEEAVISKQTDGVGPDIPDSPAIVISNDQLAFDIPKDASGMSYSHGGLKTLDALTIANSTLGYNELPPDANGEYKIITDPSKINEKVNMDVLKPGRLQPGTNLRFEVDKEYDGAANINEGLLLDEYGKRMSYVEKFEDFIDKNGKIPADKMPNVPIKIVDSNTGRTVGYVKKHDFIMAKYPNTVDYRNIVDIKFDENGKAVDNLAEQSKRLLDTRRAIVEGFNANGKPITGKTTNKGGGQVILNWKTNLNTEKGKVELGFARASDPKNSLLPDERLQVAIIDNGKANTSKNYQFDKPIITSTKDGSINLPHGSIAMMLPAANGKFFYAPLIGQKLAEGKRRTSVNTVAHAIELYLNYDGQPGPITDELRKIEDNTGHHIGTEAGLRNFINQYFTYTQRFNESDTTIGESDKSKVRTEQFLFNVWDKVGSQNKGNIRIGWSYSGQPVVEAKLVNGKLDPQFIEALEQGFNSRPRAVVYTDTSRNLRGINSNGTFKDAVYTSGGKWVHKEFPSYNEYVKSFSKTAVYGRNQLSDGTYSYAANPSIPYELHTPEGKVHVPEANESTNKVELQEPKSFDTTAVDFFDGLSNDSPNKDYMPVSTKEIGTAPENSRDLSIESLEEKFNFTPEAQRNGKTVKEVYDELTSRGHTFIPDGFNPFTRCL